MTKEETIRTHFSDFFEVSHEVLEHYGALDISLLLDNPAFIDPFLIFNSKKVEYKKNHEFIVDYLFFLKKQSGEGNFAYHYYTFPEVKELWLGYSKSGNAGQGLNKYFAEELNRNLIGIFGGQEKDITKGTHIEKLCIIGERVGADKVSDFTANLIKGFLVKYTAEFAEKNINKKFIAKFRVSKLYFDFDSELWIDGEAFLPINPHKNNEYVLLTPRDILVKEQGWISTNNFLNSDQLIINSISNDDLRFKINQYFTSLIPDKYTKKGFQKDFSKSNRRKALKTTALKYPEVIDYFIKEREKNGDKAVISSFRDTNLLEQLFYSQVKELSGKLKDNEFYELKDQGNSFLETLERVKIFKNVMEKRDGYLIFWDKNELRKFKEEDVDRMLDLVFATSNFSVDKQVNNGRGESDIKISKGAFDVTLIETKLAKNSKLKNNLNKQLDIYKQANNTNNGVYVILYFFDEEYRKVCKILEELELSAYVDKTIFLIDCRVKISASKVK